MEKFVFNNKEYFLDSYGFLNNVDDWDENFAEGMALQINMSDGLTDKHLKVIRFIREKFITSQTCPSLWETMEYFQNSVIEFRQLFPTGYQRGACRIAGISYDKGYLNYHHSAKEKPVKAAASTKVYRVNSKGFLIDWTEWDEEFALSKSDELKMPSLLTEKHWEIIRYLRDQYGKNNSIANIYELCEAINMSVNDIKDLFPDGYHRGAIKISGLRLL